ncbi:MAG: cytochrome c family protein [Spirochaetes bacterium]|nr:cytochrome c family protein [Spirochaetota bacterium]
MSYIKIALIVTVIAVSYSCKKYDHFELSRFIPPETCGGCHTEIYDQWKGSLHQQSHYDAIYREISLRDLKGLTDGDEIMEAESCVKCHTPVGFVTGNPMKTSNKEAGIPVIAKEGVQCDFCHSSTGARELYNAMMKLDPGHGESRPGIKRGPFKDSHSSYHETAYSEFHTESEICAVCHDVRHVVFGTRLETPYEEWKNSPYNSKDLQKRITCQGCHMYQRPGVPATGSTERPKNPGKASSDGPDRDHIYTHYFVGANTVIPSMIKNTAQYKMAEERLKNAAVLEISGMPAEGKIKITIKNTGAGHKIPTGLTNLRQVWLEIVITSPGGELLYSAGKLDSDGRLPKNTAVYNTVFGDGSGKPVMNLAKAREILSDRRIPPGGELSELIDAASFKGKSISVEARLFYRSAPQDEVDSVFGRGKIRIPAIEMARIKTTLAF